MRIVVLLLPLVLSGCAQMFACKTDASSVIRADGTRELTYSSCKEQVGLDAEIDPVTGKFHVRVDKAGTQESVVAAALAQQIMVGKLVESLLPLLTQQLKPTPPVPFVNPAPPAPPPAHTIK